MSDNNLLDADAAAAAREDGIRRADENANRAWKLVAYYCIKTVAARLADFTADEVWQELEKYEIKTHERSALGPLMRRAADEGLIRWTGQWRPTKMPVRHRDIKVWTAI